MKKHLLLFLLLSTLAHGQTKGIPCTDSADRFPGRYTDHTNTKYPSSLQGKEKAAMQKVLIAIEKIEEESRKNFELKGCEARVSFSNYTPNANTTALAYGYQLGVYAYVCHVTEKVVKTVDEYRTVFRVSVNAQVPGEAIKTNQTGEFFLERQVTYQVPLENVRAAHYFSERSFVGARSDDYKNLHAEFLKLNEGQGYVESYLSGSREDSKRPSGYQWISRVYQVLPEGMTVLVPLSRRQYLEDLLEYFEYEKLQFQKDWEYRWKNSSGNTSEPGIKRRTILEADKTRYPKLHEAKKAKVMDLLSTKSPEWLAQQAVVDLNLQDGFQRLENVDKFYDKETEKTQALYIKNPALLKKASGAKPLYFEVQFRYEKNKDRDFSQRLFDNFLKNFDWENLKKML